MTGFKESDHPREERGRFVAKPRAFPAAYCVWCSLAGAAAGAALLFIWVWFTRY